MKQALIAALCIASLSCFSQTGPKPGTYIITADSVKLTSCDSSELIIENHTQNVPGFLFNTGKGRTIFKRGLQSIGGGSYIFGADTLNPWVQGGNSFGTTGILGTLDNNHLDLYSADTQRVRLTNTGNLLVGTTTDNGLKLQVNGSGYFNGSGDFNGAGAFAGPIYANAPSTDGAGGYYYMNMGNQTTIGGYGYNMYFRVLDGAWYTFQFGTGPNLGTPLKDFTIRTIPSGNVQLVSNYSYFDLYGVQNTFTPASGMTIMTDGYNNMDGLVVTRYNRSTSMTDPIFTVRESDTTVLDALKNGYIGIGTNSPTAQFHTTGSVRFAGLTNDSTQTQVLVTDASGNVYYRNASTLAANDLIRSSLAVNGPITAQKLTLATKEWPDYVFDSTYRLPSLADVGTYIHKEHHLPGTPTAAEVEKDGLDVGASQALLMKKIEELTLYNIQLATKLEAQDKAPKTGNLGHSMGDLSDYDKDPIDLDWLINAVGGFPNNENALKAVYEMLNEDK